MSDMLGSSLRDASSIQQWRRQCSHNAMSIMAAHGCDVCDDAPLGVALTLVSAQVSSAPLQLRYALQKLSAMWQPGNSILSAVLVRCLRSYRRASICGNDQFLENVQPFHSSTPRPSAKNRRFVYFLPRKKTPKAGIAAVPRFSSAMFMSRLWPLLIILYLPEATSLV